MDIEFIAKSEYVRKAFELCWKIQKDLCNNLLPDLLVAQDVADMTLKDIHEIYKKELQLKNVQAHSQIICDEVMTLMSTGEKMQYFFMLPEPEQGFTANLPDAGEYIKAFAWLADPEILNALLVIHKSKIDYAVPLEHFAKALDRDTEKTEELIKTLVKHGFLHEEIVNINDIAQTFYRFSSKAWFVALLVLVKECIEPMNYFALDGGLQIFRRGSK